MYFPKEIWWEIKSYVFGQEYWKRKMNENFTFKGIYFFRPCELIFTTFSSDNSIIREIFINTFIGKKEIVIFINKDGDL